MTTTADLHVDRTQDKAETRIASYLLAEYLERLGVEVVFGLCGHTVIAFLDALAEEPHPVHHHAPRAGGGPCRGRLRARLGQAGRAAHAPRPGIDQRRHRRGQRRAGLHPAGRHRRRRAVLLLRPPSPSGSEPASGRRSVPDLSAVLQARVPRGPAGRPAAHDRARVPPGPDRAPGTGAGRRSHGHLLRRPPRGGVPPAAHAHGPAGAQPGRPGEDRGGARPGRAAPPLRRRRSDLGRGHGGAGRSGRGPRGARRAQPHGQGVHAGGPSPAPGHDRLLGHAHRQREVPDRGLDPGRGHPAGGSELQLVGSALHVRHPAHPAHPHRRRPRGDRPELPDRARGRGRRQARAGRPLRGRARPGAREARRPAPGDRGGAPGLRRQLARAMGVRPVSPSGRSGS